MRLLLAACLACLACAGSGAPSPWPADAGAAVAETLCVSGFVDWGPDDGGTRAQVLGQVAPFHVFRMDFTWSRIEGTPGHYDFSALDPAVTDLQAHGLRVLGILDYDNPLYEGPDGGPLDSGVDTYAPTNVGAYTAFAAAAAEHFGPAVDYELWNEPNNAFSFWKAQGPAGSNPDPAAYAALAASAAPAIHSACPTCRVFGGSLDYQGQELGDQFLAEMLAAQPGLEKLFDALSYHAYPDYVPVVPPDFAGASASSTADRPEVPLVTMVARLRAEIARAGDPTAFPVALTEVGWTTGPDWVTPEQQASDLVRASLLSFSTGGLASCLYTLHDGESPADPEQNFGIYAADGTAKPAVAALTAMQAALGDAAFEADRGAELALAAGEHALSFLASDRRVTALYSDAAPRRVQVPAHAAVGKTQLVAAGGMAAAVSPEGGRVAVTLGPDPQFLVELR